MTDFAKLFQLEGVGQVLVLLEEHPEEEMPCVCFRIPDLGSHFEFRMRLSLKTEDYDRAEQHARLLFDAVTEENIGATIASMVKQRTELEAEVAELTRLQNEQNS